jgi:hypothetical protein
MRFLLSAYSLWEVKTYNLSKDSNNFIILISLGYSSFGASGCKYAGFGLPERNLGTCRHIRLAHHHDTGMGA